jgi:HPt (histidine-containing phosphotransfer) domain-containing protein
MAKKTEATILPPDKSLRQKLGNRKLESLIDKERIASAQQAVFNNLDQFLSQMQTDLKALELLIEEIEQGYSGDLNIISNMEAIFFSIKSSAGTFDYMLASRIAKLAHDFIIQHRHLNNDELQVVRAHCMALQGVFKHNVRGEGNPVGKELLANLTLLQGRSKTGN